MECTKGVCKINGAEAPVSTSNTAPASNTNDFSGRPAHTFYGHSLSIPTEGLEETIIPRLDNEYNAGVYPSLDADKLTGLTAQTLVDSGHPDTGCTRAWSSSRDERILCTAARVEPEQWKATKPQDAADPFAVIDIRAERLKDIFVMGPESKDLQRRSRSFTIDVCATHPGHLVGVEVESIYLKIISPSVFNKGDVLAKTKATMNGYPLLAITAERNDTGAAVEIVTAPLSVQDHIKHKTEDMIFITKLALFLNEEKAYISIKEFVETFNRYLYSIFQGENTDQYLMEIPSTTFSLRDSSAKYVAEPVRVMTRPGAADYTGIVLTKIEKEIMWYRQTSFSFNWLNISRFNKLFCSNVKLASHISKYPMIDSCAKKWIQVCSIARNMMICVFATTDQPYLMTFFAHWISRVLSIQSSMAISGSKTFNRSNSHPVRFTNVSIRVSFHQEIFEILGESEINLFHSWLSIPRHDEDYLVDIILCYIGNAFKGIYPKEMQDTLSDFMTEVVMAETRDIVECIKLRKKTGPLQVCTPERDDAYVQLPDGTRHNLPCRVGEVMRRITHNEHHYFYYVKPVKMINGNPFVIVEYRLHNGHTNNPGHYIPFNHGTETLEGRPDDIELQFLETLWR